MPFIEFETEELTTLESIFYSRDLRYIEKEKLESREEMKEVAESAKLKYVLKILENE